MNVADRSDSRASATSGAKRLGCVGQCFHLGMGKECYGILGGAKRGLVALRILLRARDWQALASVLRNWIVRSDRMSVAERRWKKGFDIRHAVAGYAIYQ